MSAVKTIDGNSKLIEKNEKSKVLESVLIQGDLKELSPEDRVTYYNKLCEIIGLNPFTRPFEYMVLGGKLVLYVRKDATEQLRKINDISIDIITRELVDGVYSVTARATDKNGRHDESIGAVYVGHLKGEPMANAFMKAETKAKRRVTLSISGLGMLDESEISSIPSVQMVKENKTIEIDKKTELLKELDSLINSLSYDEETINKWLKWGNVEKISDLSEANLIKLINQIKDRAKNEKIVNQ